MARKKSTFYSMMNELSHTVDPLLRRLAAIGSE
jgi:hypothetical protein